MARPKNVQFTGLTLQRPQYTPTALRVVVHPGWSRIVCSVPTNGSKLESVLDWCNTNTTGEWSHYHFMDFKDYSAYQLVLNFSERNDALMFKLQDAHRIWEQVDMP